MAASSTKRAAAKTESTGFRAHRSSTSLRSARSRLRTGDRLLRHRVVVTKDHSAPFWGAVGPFRFDLADRNGRALPGHMPHLIGDAHRLFDQRFHNLRLRNSLNDLTLDENLPL